MIAWRLVPKCTPVNMVLSLIISLPPDPKPKPKFMPKNMSMHMPNSKLESSLHVLCTEPGVAARTAPLPAKVFPAPKPKPDNGCDP